MSWHRAGDYLVARSDGDPTLLIHQLSTKSSQAPFKKAKADIQDVCFHPTRPYLVVAEKRRARIYDLQKQALVKKLQCPARWISTVDVHPGGDHLLLGTFDRYGAGPTSVTAQPSNHAWAQACVLVRPRPVVAAVQDAQVPCGRRQACPVPSAVPVVCVGGR